MLTALRNIAAVILIVVSIICFSIVFIFHCRGFYYFEVDYLDIPEYSGMSKETVISNYNTMMNFFNPFSTASFRLDTLPFSQDGEQHFNEVKNITNTLFFAFMISLPLGAFLLHRAGKRRHRVMIAAGVTAPVLICLLGLPLLLFFDWALTWYHEVVFRNDLWLFPFDTDPIVMILPEEYYWHCTLLIMLIISLLSSVLLITGIISRKKVLAKKIKNESTKRKSKSST